MDHTRLNEAIADFALLTLANQEVLAAAVGPTPDWQLDLHSCTLTLGRPYRVALIGSWAEPSDTFWWGWANVPLGLGPDHPVNAPVASLRGRAEGLGMPELACPDEFAVAGTNDMGWLPAAGIASVTGGLLGADALYSGPYDGGRVWVALLDAPPPRPDPVTFPRLASMAVDAAAASPQDVGVRHRQMIALYASRRGLGPERTPDGALVLRWPGGSQVTCSFDELGRLVDMSSRLLDADVPDDGED